MLKFLKQLFSKKNNDYGYTNTLQFEKNYCRICRVIPKCNLKTCKVCDRGICVNCKKKSTFCSKKCIDTYLNQHF